MIISSHISADLQTPGYPPLVHAVQGEQYSRQIKMTLYSGGVAWTVPGGTYIAMRYEKPDGTHGYYDTLPDGTKAWSAEGNMVSIYVAPQMLTAPGVVQGQLEIIQNTSILASFPMRLKVAANLAATLQKSEDYVNWVEWMEERITQIWEDAVASGELTGPQGPPPTKLGDVTDYQSSPSGDTIPTGEWTETIPAVPQGQYLWTRVTTTWDSGSPVVSYTSARQGVDGASVTRLSSVTDYQVGESGERVPTGEWSEAIPAVPQGKFLWTRRTQTYSSGPPTVDYSVVRQPVDGTGSVSSVFGISPGPDGNVPTTGALEALGGLSTSGGTMTGPINMNGQPLTGLNPPTGETEAATKGYVDGAFRTAAPVNLLDNSNFMNPVNQRGLAAYSGPGQYFIDRWVLDCGNSVQNPQATLTKDGIKVSMSGPTGYVGICQRIAAADLYKGQRMTAAVKTKEYGIRVANFTFGENHWEYFDNEKFYFIHFNSTWVYFRSEGGTSDVTYMWAALYPGEYTADTLPEYRPKGYAAELAECQRYFIKFPYSYSTSGFLTGSALAYWMYIFLPTTMRVNPTITATGWKGRTSSGYSAYTGSNYKSFTVIGNTRPNGSLYAITDTIDTAVDPNNTVMTFEINGLELSADL